MHPETILLFKPKIIGRSDTKTYHDDDGGDDFESVKHFPYRLVGRPRWQEFDSFTARFHS